MDQRRMSVHFLRVVLEALQEEVVFLWVDQDWEEPQALVEVALVVVEVEARLEVQVVVVVRVVVEALVASRHSEVAEVIRVVSPVDRSCMTCSKP